MKINNVKFIILLGMVCVLTACQPPKSSEPAGVLSAYLYWKLQRQELSQQLIVPVDGIKARDIADTWGGARSEGRTHQGVDIFAKKGTAVLSTTQGIVTKKGLDSLGGKVVWVIGPHLSRHYYAHLDDYSEQIQEGDWVEVGQILGYVGNTGNAKTTPPHLHYGIYLNGVGAINPYPLLMKK